MNIQINLTDNQISVLSMYLKDVAGVSIVDKSAIENELKSILKDKFEYMADCIGYIEDTTVSEVIYLSL